MATAETAKPPEPITRDWTSMFAFGLPAGSIRAIMAILILGTSCGLVVARPDLALPDYLRDLLFLILGHYFALRRGQAEPQQIGPPPLFLPRGSIRLLILLGFATVVGVLVYRGAPMRPSQSPAVYTLYLVAGFLIGVITSKINDFIVSRGHRPHRLWADMRAGIALLAALLLVALAWNEVYPFLPQPRGELPGRARTHLSEYGFDYIFSAIVGFYFGSRS
jgi:hypothetical protein